jgi:CheY-like chemotaxis protein/nitrogen-specific signal transduction histidine kinase
MKQSSNYISPTHDSLRRRAEKKLMASPSPNPESEADVRKLIYELQVHQIELQIQNEELMRAKERAELAENKYTELFKSAPSGYLILSKQGEIFELNVSAARLLNKEQSQLVNKRFTFFLTYLSKVDFNSFIDRVFKNHQKETCEVALSLDSQSPSYLTLDGITSTDRAFCLLTMVDITHVKHAEESIFQLNLANEAIKFKQSFLANISHEMRTPLTGILGIIDLMHQTELNAIQFEYITTLKNSSDNLKEIINQVLDYSKIEAGKIRLKPTLFSVKSTLEEIFVVHKAHVNPLVDFSIQTDHKLPEFVYADQNRIIQVVNNLLFNALKFTSNGSVELNSQLVSADASGEHVVIKISISDTGMGIPDEMKKKLFVPFSQIDNNDSRSFEGTGLGLSICKQLVMLLGGEIGVESEYMNGSTFWFTFPAQIGTPAAKIKENGNTNSDGNLKHPLHLKILFAEDKQVNQKVIGLLLNSMGHEVTIAVNGEQAISLYEGGKFDLILMDIQMPVMDGITATRKLKEMYEFLPPIVGLSANAFEGDRDKYMVLGLDEYLTKPFNKEEFIELITRILD